MKIGSKIFIFVVESCFITRGRANDVLASFKFYTGGEGNCFLYSSAAVSRAQSYFDYVFHPRLLHRCRSHGVDESFY